MNEKDIGLFSELMVMEVEVLALEEVQRALAKYGKNDPPTGEAMNILMLGIKAGAIAEFIVLKNYGYLNVLNEGE